MKSEFATCVERLAPTLMNPPMKLLNGEVDEQRFGNEFYDYDAVDYRVRFLKDRGQCYILVAAGYDDVWHNLSDVIDFIDPAAKLTGDINGLDALVEEAHWIKKQEKKLREFVKTLSTEACSHKFEDFLEFRADERFS